MEKYFAVHGACHAKRELSDNADFVLDVDFQILRLKHRREGFVENAGKFSGNKAVPDIIGEPRLQPAKRLGPQSAAAINKAFIDSRHFGDMGMDWNGSSIRQNETHGGVGMFFQFCS